MPILKEVSVITKFASTRTSLLMFDWLTIADTYFLMKKAKFKQKSKEKAPFVYKLNFCLKMILSIMITLMLLAVVVGPLIPFSRLFSLDSVFEIEGAQIKIDILSNKA